MTDVPLFRRRSHTVLVIEDDSANRQLLASLLTREHYTVRTAADGESGLIAALDPDLDLILLDIGLPKIDGLEVTRRLRLDRRARTVPIILLTGRAGVDEMVMGLDAGADDFVSKPFQRPELLARIRSAIRMREAILGMETAQAVVAALANAVEAKDVTTELHCQRMAGLAAQLGEKAGLTDEDLEALTYGALLHDVGKIGVPEGILTKPGPLSPEEWTVLRRHPEIGERICQPLELSRAFVTIVRHHHERWDGFGYPDRIAGEVIPQGARIVGLVDAFDAMTHDRPYREALSLDVAMDEIRSGSGRQFDPSFASAFLGILETTTVKST
jgi:putative two-component system response regulator